MHTVIHALSGIRTHYPSARESEGSSYLRPRGQCDRHQNGTEIALEGTCPCYATGPISCIADLGGLTSHFLG
jgi:hypothetical protein